jgi:hypothetical protein
VVHPCTRSCFPARLLSVPCNAGAADTEWWYALWLCRVSPAMGFTGVLELHSKHCCKGLAHALLWTRRLSSVEAYDPREGRWTELTSMQVRARADCSRSHNCLAWHSQHEP